MKDPNVLDLINLLTMHLGEISSVADNLGEVLFNNACDKDVYKSAYAIKTMILDLEKKSVELGHEIYSIQKKTKL